MDIMKQDSIAKPKRQSGCVELTTMRLSWHNDVEMKPAGHGPI